MPLYSRFRSWLLATTVLLFAWQCQEADHIPPDSIPPEAEAVLTDSLQVDRWEAKAIQFVDAREYDSALVYYQRAVGWYRQQVETAEDSANWEKLVHMLNRVSLMYKNRWVLDTAHLVLMEAENIAERYLDSLNPERADTYGLLANLYDLRYSFSGETEELDKLDHYAHLELDIKEQILESTDVRLGRAYYNMSARAGTKAAREYLGIEGSELISYLKRAHDIFEANDEYLNVGVVLADWSEVLVAQGSYQEALAMKRRGIGLMEAYGAAESKKAVYIMRLGSLGNLHERIGDFDSAYHYYQRVNDVMYDPDADHKWHQFYSLSSLGNLAIYKGDYAQARVLFERAIALIPSFGPADHGRLPRALTNLGTAFYMMGDYVEAQAYYREALQQKRQQEPFEQYPEPYVTNLIDVAQVLGEHKYAIEQLQMGAVRALRKWGPQSIELAKIHYRLGTSYAATDAFLLAEQYFQSAIEMFWARQGERSGTLGEAYLDLGHLYRDQGAYAEAIKAYLRGSRIDSLIFGADNPLMSTSLLAIAEAYSLAGAFDAAEANFTRALMPLGIRNEAPEDSVWARIVRQTTYPAQISQVLGARARSRLREYERNPEPVLLQRALQDARWGWQAASQQFGNLRSQEAQTFFLENVFPLFETGASAASLQYQTDQQPASLLAVYEAMEQSKGTLLRQAINRMASQEYFGIPGELTEREQALSQTISAYSKLIYDEQEKGDSIDAGKIDYWQGKVFRARRERDSLNRLLKVRYPAYHQLRFDASILDLAPVTD